MKRISYQKYLFFIGCNLVNDAENTCRCCLRLNIKVQPHFQVSKSLEQRKKVFISSSPFWMWEKSLEKSIIWGLTNWIFLEINHILNRLYEIIEVIISNWWISSENFNILWGQNGVVKFLKVRFTNSIFAHKFNTYLLFSSQLFSINFL